MNYLKFSLGIFIVLAATRFIPHPPNFTSLIALSFYTPAIFGIRFIPGLIFSFLITDLIIGFHTTIFFTWGSIIFIGLMSQFFKQKISKRITGSLLGTLLFFLITNFGVWSIGSYGYSLEGLISCYILAIPFFGQTFISTLLYVLIFEFLLVVNKKFEIIKV